MSWSSHDSFFGFIHSFKFNRNNILLGGRSGVNDPPYPTIAKNPNVMQVWQNWNRADTGLLVTFFFLGLALSRRLVTMNTLSQGLIERRSDFRRYHRVITVFGFALAMRNSCYRLEGYVPNGLPKKPITELVKYDYTTPILSNTFWKYLFEIQQKPQNL